MFSPFVWALYRKLWGWATVIFVTEVFLPVVFIVFGSYDMGPSKLVYLGYAGLIANRLFWPAVAHYLYCRHARGTIRRLHMMSPNFASESDIANAGGTSPGSVMVGLVVAAVMAMFLWSVAASLHESSQEIVVPSDLFEDPQFRSPEYDEPILIDDLPDLEPEPRTR